MSDYHEGIWGELNDLRRTVYKLQARIGKLDDDSDGSLFVRLDQIERRVAALESATLAICPACGGSGEGYVPAETVGEQQPAEYPPCELCKGKGKVTWAVMDAWDMRKDDKEEWLSERMVGIGRALLDEVGHRHELCNAEE